MRSIMFADDTTLSQANENVPKLINTFKRGLRSLNIWCENNRLDINWNKTFAMFITNKHVILPTAIEFNGKKIEVVKSFKLLGVTIDNKLNFSKYVGELRKDVNKRLFSIRRLFYLATPVKIQFFKSFILPYFDYCSTLLLYFSKQMIQKIANAYNYCLFKLIGFRAKVNYSTDFNIVNNNLSKYKLLNFQHRLINKLLIFSHKIINLKIGPVNLKNSLQTNLNMNKSYCLRNQTELVVPKVSKMNNFGKLTFRYFFSKFINKTCVDDIRIDEKFFKLRMSNNLNIIFNVFILNFDKFDLTYKNFFYS